jgi:hypothetical protein
MYIYILARAFKTDIHVNNKTSIRTDMHKKQSTYTEADLEGGVHPP